MNIDITSLLAGISLTSITGWLASFFALRKDEKTVHIEQITKERSKWRDNMRKLTDEICVHFSTNHEQFSPEKTSSLRARLATSLNPKCAQDNKILQQFEKLSAKNKDDIIIFEKQMSLLLKHDWERVKWECTAIYIKPFVRFTKKQRLWRSSDYREIESNE